MADQDILIKEEIKRIAEISQNPAIKGSLLALAGAIAMGSEVEFAQLASAFSRMMLKRIAAENN